MSDITFLVQGKLNEASISNVDTYLKYGKILFSGYKNDNPSLINIINNIASKNKNVAAILSDPVEKPEHNHQNIYLQGYTTLAGLQHIDTELTIKVRSDEKYENWEEFIKKLRENMDKYNTTNLFFRPHFRFKLHPSDHVIGSSTKLLNLTFSNLLANTIKAKNIGSEQKIFVSFLLSKGINLEGTDIKQLTTDNCIVTDFTKFGRYIMRYNSAGRNAIYTEQTNFRQTDKYVYVDELESIKSLDFL